MRITRCTHKRIGICSRPCKRDLATQHARLAEARAALAESEQARAAYLAETKRTLSNRQADAQLNAMAGFAPPAAGQTTLPADYRTALAPVIAASWG